MWLPVLSFNYFEDPHESAHWWETLQLYSMWLLVRPTKPFEKTHEIAHLWEALQLSWGSLKNKPIVLHLQQWCFFDWLAVGRFSYIYFWHRFSHQILDCTEVHVRDGTVPLQVALVQQPLDLLVLQALTKVLNPEKSVSFTGNCLLTSNSIWASDLGIVPVPFLSKHLRRNNITGENWKFTWMRLQFERHNFSPSQSCSVWIKLGLAKKTNLLIMSSRSGSFRKPDTFGSIWMVRS